MGQGKDLKCGKCGYSFREMTGEGFFPTLHSEMMHEKARAGELGEILKKFLKKHKNGSISFIAVTLCCDECGNLEQGSDYTMILPIGENEVKYIKYPHTCSLCGGKMHIVSSNEERLCPHCKVPLEIMSRIWWD